jgi:lipooligosaccharide transport system permease protein
MTTLSRALRVTEYELIGYKRTWRGTVISSFLNPLLYLAAMGAGLGALVDRGTADLGVPYLAFVATGMLAATGMQAGAGEGSFPVMAGIRWRKSFHGAVTTPIDAADLVYGKVIWAAIRFTFILGVFSGIAILLGALEAGPALLAVPPAVLTGLAFFTTIMAWTVTRENELSLSSLFRFGIVPLFLFSGTFFPIAQLPGFLRPVAYVTPLFHGVELVRKIALPEAGANIVTAIPIWVHLLYLTVMAAIGIVLAARFLDRKLRP